MIMNKNIANDAAIAGAKLAADVSPGKLTLASAKIVVGNASGVGAAVDMSGDATIANTGAVTIANSAVTTAKINDSAVTLAKVSPATLDGTVAKVVAASNVIGGIPVVHVFSIADAATADYDITLTHKTRVTDVLVVKTAANAGAANTVQVKNGASAITNAIDANINDTIVARAGSLDDAQHEVAAAGTLRVTVTRAGGNAACIVYVYGFRVA